MRKIAVVVVVVLLSLGVVAVCGCGGGDEAEDEITLYTGKYWSESNPSDYIEIMPNNTFTMLIEGEETSGSCSVEEGSLRLSAGSYDETMKIREGVITAGDGTRYAIVVEGERDDSQQEGFSTRKEAIDEYCQENGIEMDSLTVSSEKEVSVEDSDWEIDYAFPAEAEGEGQFFLLHKSGGSWEVLANTAGDQTGWTAEELQMLGAPADLAQ